MEGKIHHIFSLSQSIVSHREVDLQKISHKVIKVSWHNQHDSVTAWLYYTVYMIWLFFIMWFYIVAWAFCPSLKTHIDFQSPSIKLLKTNETSTAAWRTEPLLLSGAGQVITTWWREEASSLMAWCLGTDRLASSCRQEGMGTGGDPLCRANGSCLHVCECVWSGLAVLVGIVFRQFAILGRTF